MTASLRDINFVLIALSENTVANELSLHCTTPALAFFHYNININNCALINGENIIHVAAVLGLSSVFSYESKLHILDDETKYKITINNGILSIKITSSSTHIFNGTIDDIDPLFINSSNSLYIPSYSLMW